MAFIARARHPYLVGMGRTSRSVDPRFQIVDLGVVELGHGGDKLVAVGERRRCQELHAATEA